MRTIDRRRLGAAALVTLLAAAASGCGGSGDDDAAASPASATTTPAAAASPTTPPGATTVPAAPAPTTPTGGQGEPAAAPPTTEFTLDQGLPMKVTLAKQCVKPGGSQTITIDMEGRGMVGYQATYSDGRHSMDKDYYGGNNGASTNEDGVWKDTWVIAPTAPAGPVVVDVVGLRSDQLRGQTKVTFEMADKSGRCA